jgi:CRISPR/Cas system-associated exonuclease Cas4 (RecB family)
MAKNLIKTLTTKPRDTKLDAKKYRLALGKAYLQNKNGVQFTTKKTFSPSTVGYGYGTCPRYWNLAFSGVDFKNNFNAQGMAAMNAGTQAHDRIQSAMGKMEYGKLVELEREVKVSDPPIRGFADAIIEIDGEEIVGEIKTVKSEGFDLRKDTSTGADSHIVQLLIYMKAMGLSEGFFLYENKNSHEVAVIPIVMSEENEKYVDYIFDWMKEVYAAWQEKKNIKRPFKQTDSKCNYCPIKNACWEMPDGRTKIDPLQVRSQ